jgi:hypothetical protein
VKYCWVESLNDEEARGPFDTIADVKADAVACDVDNPIIMEAVYPDPYLVIDPRLFYEEVLDHMDEWADDDGFYGEDIFKIENETEAKRVLDAMIRTWAKAFLKPITFTARELEAINCECADWSTESIIPHRHYEHHPLCNGKGKNPLQG